MTFRGWPVGRALAGLTAAGFTILIITRNLQTSSRMSLNGSQQPAARTAFWRARPSFLRLRLHSSEQVSPTTKRLRFELPTPDTISGLGLCSAVLTAAWPKGSLFPVLRPYTPVSRLNEPGYLDLTVKQYSGGKMSTHLHSLSPGDTLLFAAVIPTHLSPPLYQLAQVILNSPDDTKTKVNLIYGVNEDSEILFRDRSTNGGTSSRTVLKPHLSLATQSPAYGAAAQDKGKIHGDEGLRVRTPRHGGCSSG
ncbi:putative cytochrome-b5 reductase [Microsporum audouinii]